MYQEIKSALDKSFIETEKVARILSLSLSGHKNCLLWGEGGHAKSTMVSCAVEGLKLSEDCFIQSFGEGMDESRLFGGLNYEKLETEKVLEYHVERSFLNSKVAVFEELFDAPPVVLLALKDTLTAKELRNGAQRCKMKTECIIALTNRNPAEISDMGAAAHALVERFPLQLNVKWETYNGDAFVSLFMKVKPKVNNKMQRRLAFLIDRAISEGAVISPRTAIHALETLVNAKNQGMKDRECYQTLAFIPGFETILQDIDTELKEAEERSAALERLDKVRKLLQKEEGFILHSKKADHCLHIRHRLEQERDELSQLRVPDNLIQTRDKLRDELSRVMELAMDHSLKIVKESKEKITKEGKDG